MWEYKNLFLCIVDDKEVEKGENKIGDLESTEVTPHISINVLKGIVGFYILKITTKMDKHSNYIMLDSSNTHNFINYTTANKLHCNFVSINFIVIKTTNGGTMHYMVICKGSKWRIQRVSF